MGEGEAQSFLVIFSAIAFCLAVTVVILFVLFQRRKNRLLLQRAKDKEIFERALSETQIEIREETLRNISWELHDNIGQLMTLAKIQVQQEEQTSPALREASETMAQAIRELRTLSKLINPEALKNLTLAEAVQLEMDRFNRMQFLQATLTVTGSARSIDPKEEIILFRILQEFFSNTVKHSKASELKVVLDYGDHILSVTAADNGVGFEEKEDMMSGIGLKNMRNRAQLVNAELDISSEKNKGTRLQMTYNFVD